jgi:5-methylcytosine-specific restriction endonuclease McrA
MNNKKPNAAQVWKQMEDLLAPRLGLSTIERVIYSHLVRHSRLEGKLRFRFTMAWLARGCGLSRGGAIKALRRLVSRDVVRVFESNNVVGHVVEVRLPDEIDGLRTAQLAAAKSAVTPRDTNMEDMDFQRTRQLQAAIHAREGGQCFYCLRQLLPNRRCLDHVVPQAQSGNNSYRNLVSCCLECNGSKAVRSADEFLRCLYRHRRLSTHDLSARLRALDDLAAGKLIPPTPVQRKNGNESKEGS